MNQYSPILQEQWRFMPLPEEEVDAIEALCKASELYFSKEQIASVAVTLPVYMFAEFLTFSRIIQMYRTAVTSNITNFILTAEILEKLVKHLDQHSQFRFGFYFPELINSECKFLVPEAIWLLSPMGDFARPILSFFMNSAYLQCKTAGAALLLLIIYRFRLGHPEFKDEGVEWAKIFTPIIYEHNFYCIPSILNGAGIEMRKQIQIQREDSRIIQAQVQSELESCRRRNNAK